MTSRAKALNHFKRVDPRLYEATRAHHQALPLELPAKRTRDELFSALVSIVVSQQLGTAAADSIFARVKTACGGRITSQAVAKVSERTLRKAGLSGAKIKAIKTMTQCVKSGALDLISLKRVPEDEASARLTALWGLGPWSVEMFMLFALGRADVFSPGDLGLARSIELIYGLPKNTDRTSLLAYSGTWSPYRSWACILLWRSRDAASPPPLTKGRHR